MKSILAPILTRALAAVALTGAAGAASAHGGGNVQYGLPVPPAIIVGTPGPMYYPPQPPRVVVRPAPVYYPPVVVVDPYRDWHRPWHHHHHHHPRYGWDDRRGYGNGYGHRY